MPDTVIGLELLPVPPDPLQDDCLVFVVDGNRLLLASSTERDYILPCLAQVVMEQDAHYYLGRLHGRNCIALPANALLSRDPELEWLPLRSLFDFFSEAEFAMAGRAMQVLIWATNHRFCSRCGSPCEQSPSEFAMCCPQCNYRQYPRISPCIIVLVTRGEQALLAHGVRFPEAFYSCLAGFMEPGETAEQAVAREVREEVGIEITDIRYHGSQSWPFPHSLMLGFTARWQSGEICVDEREILSAHWFDREELPRLPTSGSIARQLIDGWLAVDSGT